MTQHVLHPYMSDELFELVNAFFVLVGVGHKYHRDTRLSTMRELVGADIKQYVDMITVRVEQEDPNCARELRSILMRTFSQVVTQYWRDLTPNACGVRTYPGLHTRLRTAMGLAHIDEGIVAELETRALALGAAGINPTSINYKQAQLEQERTLAQCTTMQ
jgi:hypothetical protein